MNIFYTRFRRDFNSNKCPFEANEIRCLEYRIAALIQKLHKLDEQLYLSRITSKWVIGHNGISYENVVIVEVNIKLSDNDIESIQYFVTAQTSRSGHCLVRNQWYPVKRQIPGARGAYYDDTTEGLLYQCHGTTRQEQECDFEAFVRYEQ